MTSGNQYYYDIPTPTKRDVEEAGPLLYPPRTISYVASNAKAVTVKAKLGKRFRQFEVPTDFTIRNMHGALKEQFDLVQDSGASVATAYLLWLCFGWLGIHRLYLRMHNAGSWTVWFFTGQLFGFGFLYDGLVLWKKVDEYNKRLLYGDQSGQNWLLGFKDESRPNMFAAYVLWFFFGWAGIHRWYTGYHTTSSFLAWFCTGQMFGFGWLYDVYYTSIMVNYPRFPSQTAPFFVKALHKFDYLPLGSDIDVANALNGAALETDRTLRVTIIEKKREDLAYVLWFFFGYMGVHAWYLNMGNFLIRFLTGNYFFFGYIIDGIRLQDEIDTCNRKIAGDFLPSWQGAQKWPANFRPWTSVESFESV
jgi:TM2 domain-containing membrane protein YozV